MVQLSHLYMAAGKTIALTAWTYMAKLCLCFLIRCLALPLEKAVATHSRTLAWKIPWKEEPGRLQSMGSLRVRYDWASSLSRIGEGNGNPLQRSCLENPRDGGAWGAAVYGVTQSRTRLKRLSSSSSSFAIAFLPRSKHLLISWLRSPSTVSLGPKRQLWLHDKENLSLLHP